MPKPLLGISRKKSAAKEKAARPAPATTSSKRRKTALQMTPFTSLITGQPYMYDDSKADMMNFITCTPLPVGDLPAPAMPISAVEYIKSAVLNFAKHFHDLVDAKDFWIVVYQLDYDKMDTFRNFLNPGLVIIPRTKVTVHFASDWMENLILEASEDAEMMSDDTLSSSDEEPHHPLPPGQRGNPTYRPAHLNVAPTGAILTEIPDGEPTTAVSRKYALPATRDDSSTVQANQPAATVSQPCPTPETTGPAITTTPVSEKAPETTSALQPMTVTPPTLEPRSESMETDAIPNKPSKPAQPRRVRPVYKLIDFSKLEVPVKKTNFSTVLFRPTVPGTTLQKCNPFTMNDELQALGCEVQGARNIRDGGLAVDFAREANISPLLTVTSLVNISVCASLPATTSSSSTGVISGVHWEISDEQLKDSIVTDPPTEVLSVKRLAKPGQQSWTVKVVFTADKLPDHVLLAGRRHRIRQFETRPLQCFRCGIFGHAARVCRSRQHFWTCSEDHPTGDCPNKALPKCRNCGGPHPADAATCPSRLFQQKVAEVKSKEQVPFKTARMAVTKAVRSYASALKGGANQAPAPSPPTPATSSRSQPCFKPSTPHHRPPVDTQASTMQALFKGLIAILVAAATNQDIKETLQQILLLFRSTCPDAEELFSLPV